MPSQPPLSLVNTNAFLKDHLLCEVLCNYSLQASPHHLFRYPIVVQMPNFLLSSLQDEVLAGRDLGGTSYICVTTKKSRVSALKTHRAQDSDITPGDAL